MSCNLNELDIRGVFKLIKKQVVYILNLVTLAFIIFGIYTHLCLNVKIPRIYFDFRDILDYIRKQVIYTRSLVIQTLKIFGICTNLCVVTLKRWFSGCI